MNNIDTIEYLRRDGDKLVYIYKQGRNHSELFFNNTLEAKEWSAENKVVFIIGGVGGRKVRKEYWITGIKTETSAIDFYRQKWKLPKL